MHEVRGALLLNLVFIGLAVLALGQPVVAQNSGVTIGTGESLLEILNEEGTVAVDFDVDDSSQTKEEIKVGKADIDGTANANVDVELIDAFSTLDDFDRAIFLDASSADIRLGSGSVANPGDAGTIFLEDGFGTTSITIQGLDGDIDQDVDNSSTGGFDGNGAVKAWAIIKSDGTVARCWNCNTSILQTRKLETGRYEVDFSVGSISNRPVLATIACDTPEILIVDTLFQCVSLSDVITIAPRQNDASSFYIATTNTNSVDVDVPFTIVVF